MYVLVTGADGFIGKNLCSVLGERTGYEVLPVSHQTNEAGFSEAVAAADAVIHLAGVNRPKEPTEFEIGNPGFTADLCERLSATGRAIPLAFSSSIQTSAENPYGLSKQAAERILSGYAEQTGASVTIYRLPNVFGKWCRPNYNSVVATFCHNIARGLSIEIHDPIAPIRLVHIDDVVNALIGFLEGPAAGYTFSEVSKVYESTVGKVADQIRAFRAVRTTLTVEPVGTGLGRALYSTYVSYLQPSSFSYGVPKYEDERGVFVEMLKTRDSGQFSFFTAHPGITRGGHYHHTKTEKFLVIKGKACFRFRHILTNETYSLGTSGDEPTIVETIPGWAHDITNIGEEEMVVMLWANENFDRSHPDTIVSKV